MDNKMAKYLLIIAIAIAALLLTGATCNDDIERINADGIHKPYNVEEATK